MLFQRLWTGPPLSLVDNSKFSIVNELGSESILSDATFTAVDLTVMTFTLTETQRIAAIRFSASVPSGGDGTPATISVGGNAFRDIAQNLNVEFTQITLTEVADTVVPGISSLAINFSTGVLTIIGTETHELSLVDPSKMILRKPSGVGAGDISLTGAAVQGTGLAFDPAFITLTEPQRAVAVAASTTFLSDGIGLLLDLASAAISDVALNPNAPTSDIAITEAADTQPPLLLSATLLLSTGILTVTAIEALDATPASQVDLSLVHVSQTAISADLVLSGATVVSTGTGFGPGADFTEVTIVLTELQRVTAIEMSATPGGDGNPSFLQVSAEAFKDIVQNDNLETTFVVSETADTIKPVPVNATLAFGTGILTINFEETIDVTPASQVKLNRFFLSDSTQSREVRLDSASEVLQPDSSTVTELAAVITPSDQVSVSIQLTELQRYEVLVNSSMTPNGDGSAMTLDILSSAVNDIGLNVNVDANELVIEDIADAVKPTFLGARLNFSDGFLEIFASEHLDITPKTNVNLARLFLCNTSKSEEPKVSLVGSTIHSSKDERIIYITLSESVRAQAIVFSGTPGGDGGALVLDVDAGAVIDASGNENALAQGITVYETADTIPPIAYLAGMHLDARIGILTIHTNETIDVTPTSFIDINNIFLADIPGVHAPPAVTIPLSTVLDTGDGIEFNITLEAFEIAGAVAISATPGGDGIAMVLDLDAGAMRDLAGNPNVLATNINVTEKPDVTPPGLLTASIDYNDGKITLTADEPLDLTPLSLVSLQNIQIGDQALACAVGDLSVLCSLSGLSGYENATVDQPQPDSFSLVLTLSEKQRVAAISVSNTPGGSGGAWWGWICSHRGRKRFGREGYSHE